MNGFANKQMVRVQFDFLIQAMREACERTIKLLEACKENPDCTCLADSENIGFCPSCKALQDASLRGGDTVTQILEITDGEEEYPSLGELSGAPDKSEPVDPYGGAGGTCHFCGQPNSAPRCEASLKLCGTCGHKASDHFADGQPAYCCDGCNGFSSNDFYRIPDSLLTATGGQAPEDSEWPDLVE